MTDEEIIELEWYTCEKYGHFFDEWSPICAFCDTPKPRDEDDSGPDAFEPWEVDV